VIRARRRVVVSLVTRVAVGRRSREAAADMAARAVDTLMGAGEGEAGLVVVDAAGWPPGARAVARLAGAGQIRGRVIRTRRRVVVGLMAGVAVGRRSRELAAHVTAGAAHRLVRAGQGEAGRVVIDAGRRSPGAGRVAVLAAAREAPLRVVRAFRVEVGLKVTLTAVGRGGGVLVRLLAAVAAVAVHARMGADQREARAAVTVRHRALVRPAAPG